MSVSVPIACFAACGEVGGGHGGERSAQADGEDVDRVGARDLGDDVERGLGPVHEVVVHRQAGEGGVRVAVADREHGVPVLHRPLDQAASGREIHDVVLVDPWGTRQQRGCVDLVGLGQVLQQLHDLIAVDDLARRGRHVLADPEGAGVDLTRPATVVEDVVDTVACAGHHALTAGVERPLERRRIGQEKVRRRQRVDEQVDCESRLRARRLVQLRGREQVLGEPAKHQIGLAQGEEPRVVLPRWIGEALVPGVRGHGARGAAPSGARRGRQARAGQVQGAAQARLRGALRDDEPRRRRPRPTPVRITQGPGPRAPPPRARGRSMRRARPRPTPPIPPRPVPRVLVSHGPPPVEVAPVFAASPAREPR